MTDTLRMKGKAESGKTVEFEVKDILSVRVSHKRNGPNVAHIDPRTIQLADDPRKQMLEKLITKIEMMSEYVWFDDNTFKHANHYAVSMENINKILDEMEAKL